jgi:predicted MFS family arabinose efflux permease
MSPRGLKSWYFVIEGANAFATSFFFNYLFFHFRDRFQFTERENLLVAALQGLVYMVCAWPAGRFAQRRGYFAALQVGFGGMALVVVVGSFFVSAPLVLVALLTVWSWAMSFTWPALEALASEGERPEALPRVIGFYNLVWAGCGALAYFAGGAIFQALGTQSLFWLPAILHGAQLVWVRRLAGQASIPSPPASEAPGAVLSHPELAAYRQPVRPQTFLRMAWWANPFAYVAMNTLVPVIPSLAQKLDLSTAMSGVFASVWFFARLGAFGVLWQWTGWHYRFRWLLVAYGVLVASFATLLLVERLWWLVLAQVAFGLAVGLFYYSSLFYSMDLGETKGEHGGLHESAIGAGMFLGPAVGSAALFVRPGQSDIGALAVGGLLVLGLAGLIAMRLRN